jgi:hypothetical protein
MSEWLKWSQGRLLVTLGISYVLFAEIVSLLLFDGATCVINPADYGEYYAERNECPALHVFCFKVAASVFEKLGDPNWVIAISAVVTAIFTVVLGIFTISVARSTRIAAYAAQSALTFTERAFVFMKYMYASPIYGSLDMIAGWDFHVVWENSGSTPTQFMVSRKNVMVWVDGNIPDDFDFPDLIKTPSSKSYMGPKATIDAGALQVSNDLLEKIAGGQARMLIWGWAEYSDVFSPNIRHRSEFCTEVGIHGSIWTAPSDTVKAPFVFLVYKQHNGTGEECYRKPMTTGFS